MGFIHKDEAFSRFLRLGRNSSHFVWFIADLKFFETKNGWVFAVLQKGDVTIFALDPLIPDEASAEGKDIASFMEAWSEIETSLKPKISLFVSVYEKFLKYLHQIDFQSIKVGREPFVELKNCIPTGKQAKGVRAARNQALRSGVRVEEWSKEKLLADPILKNEMLAIIRTWKQRNLVDIGSFLNKVDPFAYMEYRKYFIAFSGERKLEAFLVATPIPGKNSYFLEDMVVRPGAIRGTGELLTLEAMVALSEGNGYLASLGVVSLTNMDDVASGSHNLPKSAQFLMITLPRYLTKVVNVGGLEVFRKRFKPHHWENIHLAVRNEKNSGYSDSKAWLLGVFAVVRAFSPKLHITFAWLRHTIARPLRKYPISYGVLFISTVLFALINRGGHIPNAALDAYSFSGNAPISEWIWRSIISDFLYFDQQHFLASMVLLLVFIRWTERSYSTKFVFIYLAVLCVCDDLFNQLVLIRPYEYFHPKVFEKLVAFKDVGGSLWISTLVGLQLCQLRRNREVFFALIAIGSVFAFAFSAQHLVNLVINLNHFLFLVVGFISGKFRFEYDRMVSRRNSKQKPPVAKCVHPLSGQRVRSPKTEKQANQANIDITDEDAPEAQDQSSV